MQPRHASKCATTAASSAMTPSCTPFIRSMRPRGESISSPHDTYVGHAGKQNPQCTQSLIRSRYVRVRVHRHRPPTKRPGLHRPLGSKFALERAHQRERRRRLAPRVDAAARALRHRAEDDRPCRARRCSASSGASSSALAERDAERRIADLERERDAAASRLDARARGVACATVQRHAPLRAHGALRSPRSVRARRASSSSTAAPCVAASARAARAAARRSPRAPANVSTIPPSAG